MKLKFKYCNVDVYIREYMCDKIRYIKYTHTERDLLPSAILWHVCVCVCVYVCIVCVCVC